MVDFNIDKLITSWNDNARTEATSNGVSYDADETTGE